MDKRIKNLESENSNLKNQIEENKTKINFLESYLKIYNITPNYSSISSSPLLNNNNNFFQGSNIINENDIYILIKFFTKKTRKNHNTI
jgi:phage antirepressor YoqD-like protein